MGDDLSQKFAQISELLNQEGMADNIKGLIGMLANSTDTKDTSPKEQDTANDIQDIPRKNESSGKSQNSSELEDNLEMMRQVQRVMEVMRSTKDDPRMNLLNAIRPYLNSSRQKKVSNAMRILQMTSVTKLMEKDGKSMFKF